jgi:quaternary ammonium compound-resistance protein SugE
MTLAWTYLIAAGLVEIGWPIGLKWAQGAQDARGTVSGIVLAVVCMAVSGALLYLAQKQISLGTSYAVWTGIGAAGTFVIGVWFFGDPNSIGSWVRRRAHHRRRRDAEARVLNDDRRSQHFDTRCRHHGRTSHRC